MRVRQKTHIEYQVGIVRHSVLETETDARNKDRLAAWAFLKLVNNVRAQFVDVELRGVDDHIRQVAQEIKTISFRADIGGDRKALAERVGSERVADRVNAVRES